MTRDDIIKLAHETECFDDGHYGSLWMERFERFAAMVAAAEREACANEADRQAADEPYGHAKFRCANIAAAIRARSNT